MTGVEIVQRLYDAFRARDEETIRAIFHPEIVWRQIEGFPGGGTHVGADAIFENVFRRFRREWSSWAANVDEFLDAGDTVVALGRYEGVHGTTGKGVSAAFAHVYRVTDGRITAFDQYTDTLAIARAVGAAD